MNLRERLISAFRASGLTQSELARRAGVTRSVVSEYLRAKIEVNTATYDRLLAACQNRITDDTVFTGR